MNADEELYKENILDNYKNPRNKRQLTTCSAKLHELNPVCGDEITMYLEIKDNKIVEASFEGHGCAISQASVSMLTEKIKGMSLEEVKKLNEDDIQEMLGIPISINRIKYFTSLIFESVEVFVNS